MVVKSFFIPSRDARQSAFWNLISPKCRFMKLVFSGLGISPVEFYDKYGCHIEEVDPIKDPIGHLVKDSISTLIMAVVGFIISGGVFYYFIEKKKKDDDEYKL